MPSAQAAAVSRIAGINPESTFGFAKLTAGCRRARKNALPRAARANPRTASLCAHNSEPAGLIFRRAAISSRSVSSASSESAQSHVIVVTIARVRRHGFVRGIRGYFAKTKAAMQKCERELLEALQFGLNFWENGGDAHSRRATSWPRFILEDSPTRMNYDSKDSPGIRSHCVLKELGWRRSPEGDLNLVHWLRGRLEIWLTRLFERGRHTSSTRRCDS